MLSINAGQTHFGPCVVKLMVGGSLVQHFQAKDGVVVKSKKTVIEQRDDGSGTGMLDEYGTGNSATLEFKGVNWDAAALEQALNKTKTSVDSDPTAGTSAKDGVSINVNDGVGQSHYELASEIYVFKARNGVVQSVFAFGAPKAYCQTDLNMAIGTEKQAEMDLVYKLFPIRSATGIWLAGDICRISAVTNFGQV